MNETIKTILSRRSIRVFRPEQIPAEALEEVVTAGQYAPSAMGAQQWLLVAVRDRELMARLGEDCRRTLNREGDPFYGAPAAVLVFGEADGYEPIRDGSCVMATMGIAAASLGLGSCWIYAGKEFFPTDKGKQYLKELKVPDGYVPVGTLILGYAAETPQPAPRREGTVIRIG